MLCARTSSHSAFARTMMVGCTAGEGHLDGDEASHFATAEALTRSLPRLARELSCAMIVLKEYPAKYRAPLQSGRGVKQAHEIVRHYVPRLTNDRAMSGEIERVATAIRDREFDSF